MYPAPFRLQKTTRHSLQSFMNETIWGKQNLSCFHWCSGTVNTVLHMPAFQWCRLRLTCHVWSWLFLRRKNCFTLLNIGSASCWHTPMMLFLHVVSSSLLLRFQPAFQSRTAFWASKINSSWYDWWSLVTCALQGNIVPQGKLCRIHWHFKAMIPIVWNSVELCSWAPLKACISLFANCSS